MKIDEALWVLEERVNHLAGKAADRKQKTGLQVLASDLHQAAQWAKAFCGREHSHLTRVTLTNKAAIQLVADGQGGQE